MEQSVIISFSLPADLLVGLGHAAKAAGRTPADHLRAILRQTLALVPGPAMDCPTTLATPAVLMAGAPAEPLAEPDSDHSDVTARVLEALRADEPEPPVVTPALPEPTGDDPVVKLVQSVCASAIAEAPHPPSDSVIAAALAERHMQETAEAAPDQKPLANATEHFGPITYGILAVRGGHRRSAEDMDFAPAEAMALADGPEETRAAEAVACAVGAAEHADVLHHTHAATEGADEALAPEPSTRPEPATCATTACDPASDTHPDDAILDEARHVNPAMSSAAAGAAEPDLPSAAHLMQLIKTAPGWLDLQRSLRRDGLVLRLSDCGQNLLLHSWPEDRLLMPVAALGLSLEGLCLHFRAPFPGGGGLSHVLRALVAEDRGPGRAA